MRLLEHVRIFHFDTLGIEHLNYPKTVPIKHKRWHDKISVPHFPWVRKCITNNDLFEKIDIFYALL